MMAIHDFDAAFAHLTDNAPFPWQRDLYDSWFSQGKTPASCNLPTGLGKTSVIAVWLIALAHGAALPRRLVYVVNRRTVVDQTTNEVERYRGALQDKPELSVMRERLAQLTASQDQSSPLAISTLRGQFADNREWRDDPSRPAVICGTVDMIGSRLLFSGYGIGFKQRPLHAGFLGQDSLLVHDEAHLEPAFQRLIKAIEQEQEREPNVPWPKLRVMELTATSRGKIADDDGPTDQQVPVFGLTEADRQHETIRQRLEAPKKLHLHEQAVANKPQTELIQRALAFKDSGKAILIFANTVESVLAVQEALHKNKLPVQPLTGTMRGLERDRLVDDDPVFQRFLPESPGGEETVYLVCTSAGEVGVNLSGDHLICDLSTFESMAQRFGRVNRFGQFPACEVHVVYPSQWDDKHPLTIPRQRTLALLRTLEGRDVNPHQLNKLDAAQRQAAFAPEPTLLPVTDILFDAWALTTIRELLPGRPAVEPYLHGLTDWQPPETRVAWREEVNKVAGELIEKYKPRDLLDDYPLKPHELLREPSARAFKHFETMAKRLADQDVPVWLVDDDGAVDVLTLKELADKDQKDRLEGMTVLLPPSAGGLSGGMLDGSEKDANDVADTGNRQRVWNDEADPEDMQRILTIEFPGSADDEDAEGQSWRWFEVGNEGGKTAKQPVTWEVHVGDVVTQAEAIVTKLPLSDDLKKAIIVAAKFHDHGKRRKKFQTVLGNTRYPEIKLAKSGKKAGRVDETYRHEFGSLVDVEADMEFDVLTDDLKDLVLHLIAAHHGRARPHFPQDEAFDPEATTDAALRVARDVPRRFAHLQRRYGRWGLAYLESLLRAADWAASANPSAYLNQEGPQ